MTLAQLINVLYSVVDRMYLGRLPGHLALTGLGLTMPIVSILMGVCQPLRHGRRPPVPSAGGRETMRRPVYSGQVFLHVAADLVRPPWSFSLPQAPGALSLRRQ